MNISLIRLTSQEQQTSIECNSTTLSVFAGILEVGIEKGESLRSMHSYPRNGFPENTISASDVQFLNIFAVAQ